MELYFNERSIKDKESIESYAVIEIVEIYKALLKHNVTTCRISPNDNHKLFQMMNRLPNAINIRNFYFSFFRSPYESEAVEEIQDSYLEHNWIYHDEACIGFALAFLLESASLSIPGSDWNSPWIEFFIDGLLSQVRNISIKGHVDLHRLYLFNQTEIELISCSIPISEKKIVLRHDHGMDVLEDFSKRLLRSPYLIGVINSLPFNPYERKFIRKIRENGLIEIVLPWTDKGYGLVVKTTGRTYRETERIAKIIEEEYGYL